MSKYTPGPWKVGGAHPPRVWAPHMRIVAEIMAPESITRIEPSEEMEANARLIAAAPDLFLACQRMLRELNDGDISVGAEEDMAGAVKKAGGEWLSNLPEGGAPTLSGGLVVYECGHRFEMVAKVRAGVKEISLPPKKCPECG